MICETQAAQDRAINLPVHRSDAAAETQLGSKIPGLLCFWEAAPKANAAQGQLLKKGSEWSRRDQNPVRMCVLRCPGAAAPATVTRSLSPPCGMMLWDVMIGKPLLWPHGCCGLSPKGRPALFHGEGPQGRRFEG